ncbi:MAG: YCF48-related protein, partial [Rhizobacter sp.]|nr:YCF48-related protein [Rhizobacter sp.]
MPAWLRWTLIALLLALLAFASIFAARQAPHPDMFRPIGVWDFGNPAWWAYPLERNAFKRQIVRGDLAAVFALPGTQQLWSVGEGGLILHSTDDGATWVQQRPAVAPQAAGGDDRARHTSAWSWLPQATAADKETKAPPPNSAEQQQRPLAGSAQQYQASPAQQSKVPPVQQKGVSSSADLRALEPASSAASAPQQSATPATPDLANLYAVHFADRLRGWAVGANGTILATRDGGSSWAAQASGTRASLTSVQFAADGLRGWAVGD